MVAQMLEGVAAGYVDRRGRPAGCRDHRVAGGVDDPDHLDLGKALQPFDQCVVVLHASEIAVKVVLGVDALRFNMGNDIGGNQIDGSHRLRRLLGKDRGDVADSRLAVAYRVPPHRMQDRGRGERGHAEDRHGRDDDGVST